MSQPAGEVVKPGAWKSIVDEGMPVHGRPYEKGNLYVRFNVQFPDTLTRQQVTAIQKTLPPPAHDAAANGSMDVDSEHVRSPLLPLLFPCALRSRSCKSVACWTWPAAHMLQVLQGAWVVASSGS